jgi:hypothetical protein
MRKYLKKGDSVTVLCELELGNDGWIVTRFYEYPECMTESGDIVTLDCDENGYYWED